VATDIFLAAAGEWTWNEEKTAWGRKMNDECFCVVEFSYCWVELSWVFGE
jgi:hypothetical protein